MAFWGVAEEVFYLDKCHDGFAKIPHLYLQCYET